MGKGTQASISGERDGNDLKHLDDLDGLHAFRVHACGRETMVSRLELSTYDLDKGKPSVKWEFIDTVRLPWSPGDVLSKISEIVGYSCGQETEIEMTAREWAMLMAELLDSESVDTGGLEDERCYIRNAVRVPWYSGGQD